MLFAKEKVSLKRLNSLKTQSSQDYIAYLENALIDLCLMVRELENDFEDSIHTVVGTPKQKTLLGAC